MLVSTLSAIVYRYSYLRLAFEIFHNIKESVVYIWLIGKLNFDLIEITKRILQLRSQSQRRGV